MLKQSSRTTSHALDALEAALASINHHERGQISHEERVTLMERARRLTRVIREFRGAPTVAAEPPRVVVTMSEESLRQRAEADGLLSRGQSISPGELRRPPASPPGGQGSPENCQTPLKG